MSGKTIFKFVRVSLSFLVAIFLIRFVVKSTGVDVYQVWESVDRRYLAAAFLSLGVGFLLASYRWYLLLQHIKVELPMLVVIRLALIGQFFNLFVPGGVGGDLIKMVYLKKESGERFTEAVLTVLLDRILGLTGLLLLALVALGFNLHLLERSGPEVSAILIVVGAAGLGGLGIAAVFFLWPFLGKFSDQLITLNSKLPQKIQGILERLVAAFSLLRSAPQKVLVLLLMAMGGHLFATLALCALGAGYGGVSNVNFQEFLLVTQISNLVAAVPLTPGGLGGRDLIMSFLLSTSGATEQASGAVPLCVTSLLILWSCLGGFALLWERRAAPVEAEAE